MPEKIKGKKTDFRFPKSISMFYFAARTLKQRAMEKYFWNSGNSHFQFLIQE